MNTDDDRDVFLCHASEDKADIVRPLAENLKSRGLTVWLDQMEMKIGDTLTRKIDEGLAHCHFGAVIISPAVLAKETDWVSRELDALSTREAQEGRVVVLPIWHQVGYLEVAKFSPTLASKLAVNTGKGIDHVADEIAKHFGNATAPSAIHIQDARQPNEPAQRRRPTPWTHPHNYMPPNLSGDTWPALLLRGVMNYAPAHDAAPARIDSRVHRELPQLLSKSRLSPGAVTWSVTGHTSSITTKYTADLGAGRYGSCALTLPSSMTHAIKVIIDLGLNDQLWPIPLDTVSKLWADTLDTAIACDPIIGPMTAPRPTPESVELFIDIARDGSGPLRDLADAIDFRELGPRTGQEIPSLQWAELAENVLTQSSLKAIVAAWTDTVPDVGILMPDNGLRALARILGVA